MKVFNCFEFYNIDSYRLRTLQLSWNLRYQETVYEQVYSATSNFQKLSGNCVCIRVENELKMQIMFRYFWKCLPHHQQKRYIPFWSCKGRLWTYMQKLHVYHFIILHGVISVVIFSFSLHFGFIQYHGQKSSLVWMLLILFRCASK